MAQAEHVDHQLGGRAAGVLGQREGERHVEVLRGGHLSGASLDVFETEPLPTEHPLWGFEQVRITPHVSGEGPHCWERRLELLIDNARRFAAGEQLRNVVDKSNWF